MDLNHITSKAKETLSNHYHVEIEPTVESCGQFLLGDNYDLALNPFSKEFLENVQHNFEKSYYLVLWLQLNHLNNLNH